MREQAIAVEGLWSGLVRTEPGVASGWHHHVVHREINPGPTPSQEVVTRSGTGPLTINVDGPTSPAAA